ncbi:hypothetical protein [Tenacibaculum retecalamus]|nr:hypothetical protein [Tenacibaculum retecalamus]WBX70683.1 hypothetical protein PG912_10580 [Tenacibaculum retecalamus]
MQVFRLINYDNKYSQVVGHRGCPDVYPENTLLSLEETFKIGVKY